MLNKKNRVIILIALCGLGMLIIANRVFLNTLTGSLKGRVLNSLRENASRVEDLEIGLAPVTWSGILGGYLDRVRITAASYEKDGLMLENVVIISRRVHFSWKSWLKSRRLAIIRLENARLEATVSDQALNGYRRKKYPGLDLTVKIDARRIRLIYLVDFLVKKISLIYEGTPAISGKRCFSIYPRRVLLSEIKIPSGFLKAHRKELGLDIPVDLPLPVQLERITLAKGKIRLAWQEEKAK
ncbi:MAG: LmeA family phospholipid-binding protein [Bacillota bacterium]